MDLISIFNDNIILSLNYLAFCFITVSSGIFRFCLTFHIFSNSALTVISTSHSIPYKALPFHLVKRFFMFEALLETSDRGQHGA
jgi:hypothetical protein